MVIIGLITNVNTDAEPKALTGMSNNDFAYHIGDGCAYIYEEKHNKGDIIPDSGVGAWKKDCIEALDLSGYKAVRFKEIDTRTEELIKQGFLYKGLVFSLSQNAQINILALHETRNDPALLYPVAYSTLDDSNHYDVIDATDLHNMYLTALATKKAHVDTGTTLKNSIRDAVNEAAVALIIDNR